MNPWTKTPSVDISNMFTLFHTIAKRIMRVNHDNHQNFLCVSKGWAHFWKYFETEWSLLTGQKVPYVLHIQSVAHRPAAAAQSHTLDLLNPNLHFNKTSG